MLTIVILAFILIRSFIYYGYKRKMGVGSMTIQEMRRRKQALGYTDEQISILSGVPLEIVRDVFNGSTTSLPPETMLALENILNDLLPRDIKNTYDRSHGSRRDLLREESAFFRLERGRKGSFTVEDYEKLPDDKRYELIDGVLYEMAAPTATHQSILLELAVQFRKCILEHQANCRVMIAPLDVQLDQDNRTMVQPDILVICDRDKLTDKRLFGAPDLAVEILSDSSRSRDCVLKLHKYKNAGVREYWIVDPDQRKVIVYSLENNGAFCVYDFTDSIPIGISGGKCRIDFGVIDAYLKE